MQDVSNRSEARRFRSWTTRPESETQLGKLLNNVRTFADAADPGDFVDGRILVFLQGELYGGQQSPSILVGVKTRALSPVGRAFVYVSRTKTMRSASPLLMIDAVCCSHK